MQSTENSATRSAEKDNTTEDHTPKFVFLNHHQVTSGDERFVAYSEDGDGLIVSVRDQNNKNIKGLVHTDSEKFVQNIKSLIDSYKKNGGSLQDASFRICASTQEKLKSFNAINKISDLIKQKLPKDTNVPEIKEQIVYNRQQNANYKHFAVFCDKEKNKQTNHQHGKYTSEKVKAGKLFDGFSIDECKKRSSSSE